MFHISTQHFQYGSIRTANAKHVHVVTQYIDNWLAGSILCNEHTHTHTLSHGVVFGRYICTLEYDIVSGEGIEWKTLQNQIENSNQHCIAWNGV